MATSGIFTEGYSPEPPVLPSILTQPKDTTQIRCLAGEDISGHRGIFLGQDFRAVHANPNLITGIYAIGVSDKFTRINDYLTVIVTGRLDFEGWDWTPGTVWLGPDGTLTQVLPVAGPLVKIGIGSGPFLIVSPQLIAIRN